MINFLENVKAKTKAGLSRLSNRSPEASKRNKVEPEKTKVSLTSVLCMKWILNFFKSPPIPKDESRETTDGGNKRGGTWHG